MTLGTHLHWHKPAALAAVHAAARTLPGVDFHFSHGDAEAALQRRDGNVEELAYVSYARDLPHYDLVVHHGGAGILYRCLQLGIPSLVLPLDYDQFDHAARLHSAGVARRLNSLDALATAVAAALNDTALRERCLAWRDRFAGPPAETRIASAVAERLQSS